jgi:hypothetical protein
MNSRPAVILGLLLFLVHGLAAAPANDHLINALPLSGPSAEATGTNAAATREVGEPSHGFPGGKSVWWMWTAPGSGSVIVETAGSTFDTVLAAYTGSSYATMNSLASNDDAGRFQTSKIAFNVTADVTYRIAVDGFNGVTGEIQITVRYRDNALTKPLNDEFRSRAALNGPFVSLSTTTFFAGKEPGEPNHAGDPGGASVWWSWIAPSGGGVTIDTKGSNFDTLLAAYTGSLLTNLTLMASSDDVSSNQLTSSITFQATAGTEYLIAVDGFNREPGDLELHIAMAEQFQLSPPTRLSNARWHLTLNSVPGQPCEIEASEDLVTWSRLAILTNSTGVLEFTDPEPEPLPRRFYRAKRVVE